MKKSWKVAIGILAVVLVIVILALLVFVKTIKKTNYVSDDEAELFTEILETETEAPVSAELLYHLEDVCPPTEEELNGVWTLLVVGEGEKDSDWRNQALDEAASKFSSLADTADTEEAAGTESAADTEEAADTEGVSETEGETGQEERNGYGNARGIILMTINHNQERVYFYSLNTDLYAEVPGYGGFRLGDVYAAGGGSFLSGIIEQNYGVKIDQYAAIQLTDVARILEMDEFSDLDISSRGIDVIENLVYSMKDIAPGKLIGYVSDLLPYVTHNLSDVELMKMILQVPTVVMYVSIKGMLPYDGLYEEIDGLLVPQIGETSRFLKNSIYGKELQLDSEPVEDTEPDA